MNSALPMTSLRIDRGAFRASAIKSFLLMAAPFELTSAGLTLMGSDAYAWWIVILPNVVSLMVGLGVVLLLPRKVIGWLAMNFGLACLVGMVVTALSASSYFAAALLGSGAPLRAQELVKFIGPVFLFFLPFGSLYGVFVYGAAEASASGGSGR